MWRDLSAPVLVGLDQVVIGSELIVFLGDNLDQFSCCWYRHQFGTTCFCFRAFVSLKRSTRRSNDQMITWRLNSSQFRGAEMHQNEMKFRKIPMWSKCSEFSAVQSVIFVWILIPTNIRIYSCQENDMNEYPNIFLWTFLIRMNIRIYLYQNFDTNENPNKYSDQKYLNIRIYLSHSGQDWHQFCAFTI